MVPQPLECMGLGGMVWEHTRENRTEITRGGRARLIRSGTGNSGILILLLQGVILKGPNL